MQHPLYSPPHRQSSFTSREKNKMCALQVERSREGGRKCTTFSQFSLPNSASYRFLLLSRWKVMRWKGPRMWLEWKSAGGDMKQEKKAISPYCLHFLPTSLEPQRLSGASPWSVHFTALLWGPLTCTTPTILTFNSELSSISCLTSFCLPHGRTF